MFSPDAPPSGILHGSCVTDGRAALLILGPSGSGKSSLALALMALGLRLVADDRVAVSARDGALWARRPPGLPAGIEARGIGLLAAKTHEGAAMVRLVADLGQISEARMPEPRRIVIEGISLPVVHKVETPHYPAAILQYLKGGRLG